VQKSGTRVFPADRGTGAKAVQKPGADTSTKVKPSHRTKWGPRLPGSKTSCEGAVIKGAERHFHEWSLEF
jgi:hypothetical protein